jgi:glycosyltransferase involved in cell wall biosynthesis
MTKRKLLFYTHAMSGGGAERVWALLASGFAERGDEVILAVDFEATPNSDYVSPAVRRVTLGRNHLVATWRLARLLARERPDTSISALSISNLKHLAAAVIAGRRSQAIQTYHGYSHSEPQFLSRVGYALTCLSSRLLARTVAVSDGLLDAIRVIWGASKRRSLRIYNPVAAAALANDAAFTPLGEREPVVLGIGRLVGYKNFPLLVRAFAHVQPRNARLVILGEGPERAAIESEIARLGLGGRVMLAGYVGTAWPYFAKARCLALASNSETFGLVVVEALAQGLPVIATASDGPSEILDGRGLGTLVPRGDAVALAQAITATLAAPGDPAPRIVRARAFALDAALDAYARLFDEIGGAAGQRYCARRETRRA